MKVLRASPSIRKSSINPSSFKIFRTANLAFEPGTVVRADRTIQALRIRVNISAIGSLVIMIVLPAGFAQTGNFTTMGHLAKANATNIEVTDVAARAATAETEIPLASGVLRRTTPSDYLRLTDHNIFLFSLQGKTDLFPQRNIRLSRGTAANEGYLEAEVHLNFIRNGLRKHI